MHHAFAGSLGAALLTFAGAALAQAPDERPSAPPQAPPQGEGAAPKAGPSAPPREAPGAAPNAPAPPPASQSPRPRAYGSPGDDDVNFAVPATRRGGFLVGLALGGQLTGAEGTPTDYDRRGDDFRVSTRTTLGTSQAFFIGGALTDWFAFKLGFQGGSASKGGRELSSSGVLIGVEAWPLFSLGGSFRDLGLLVDFGTGGATIKDNGEEVANAGAYSLVRAGLAWDALRLWKLNFGPVLAFEHTTSETYQQNALWFGLRSVFYGAP